MLTEAVAGLLAVSAIAAAPAAPDTTVRVPGTALHFGLTLVQIHRVIRTQPAPAGGAPAGVNARQAWVRFFGLDGNATLEFENGLLARVSVKVADPPPKYIDYVEDDLTRQGFHRRCAQREGLNRSCEWTARARVTLTSSQSDLDAQIEPLVLAKAGAPVAPAPAIPDTLRFAAAGAAAAPGALDSLAQPVVLDSCHAVRPDIARQNGVFGRVVVEVSVDTSGTVVAARVVRGVPMLDEAALDCARRYRFAPYLSHGRASPFLLALPIRFTL